MKLTQILLKQHLGRQFKLHWRVQGKRTAEETGAEAFLQEKGIPVLKPEDILKPSTLPVIKDVETRRDPNWHERVCHVYRDENVLLEGLNQAKILTKTVEVQNGLPDRLKPKELPKGLNKKVKEIILNSHLFDAEQQKLPKVKDPLRPAWNFPRSYGVTDRRVNKLLVAKLLQLLESNSPLELVRQRLVLEDLHFSFPMEKNDDLIQFELKGDTVVTSTKPLNPVSNEDNARVDLPKIFPIKETITLTAENIYQVRNLYPINTTIIKHHPHTVFIHYNNTEVKNLYEEEITETQVLGRSLLKAFTVAGSYAKQLYGDSVKALPKPVTVQCVQVDGRVFHFGVLQLNTLDLDGEEGLRNVWFHTPRIPLFDSCSYISGKPTLSGYNNEVIKHLLAFYHNI